MCVCALNLVWAEGALAQQAKALEPDAPATAARPAAQAVRGSGVPQEIKFGGVLNDSSGMPLTGTVAVTFALYDQQEGGTPLWSETQNVELDQQGRYSVLLGAASGAGLPVELFSSSDSRWLGMRILAPGETEQPRVRWVSVPYALKAVDAETLGGKPASAYALAGAPGDAGTTGTPGERSAAGAGGVKPPKSTNQAVGNTTTAGFIPVFLDNSGMVGNSVLIQSGGAIGIGQSPVQTLDVNGGVRGTGLATGSRNTAADAINTGSLFLGGSNAMGLIGTNTAGFAAGALFQKASFFAGAVERMTIDGATGNVGINNTTPGMKLDVAGAIRSSSQLISTVATGTAPLSVTSTTMVPNLNAAMVGGNVASAFAQLGAANTFTGNQTINGSMTATSFSGSGANLTNVNAAMLGGFASGAFAQLSGNNAFTGNNTLAQATLGATGTATAGGGFGSAPLGLVASAFNSGTSAPVAQTFQWQAQPVGNNTANPSGQLNLLYGSGANAPAATGLSIAPTGLITFAAGQTFPGGGGGVSSVSAGDSSITIGGTASAPMVAVANGGVTAAKIAAGAVVKSLNGQTDAVTLAGTNGLSVMAGAGTVTVTSNSTPANTPSTIVSRDASGNFAANTVTLSGNLALPGTSSDGTMGVLTLGSLPFLHTFGGNGNTFVGAKAGNMTLTGIDNSVFGPNAFQQDTTGSQNAAFGSSALQNNMTGTLNSAFGFLTLVRNTTGQQNSAFGGNALRTNATGRNNAAFGYNALANNTVDGNSAFGASALFSLSNNLGVNNAAFGANALVNLVSGSSNIAIGFNAGNNLFAGESNNIYIGNGGVGGESNTIRIGDPAVHTATFIAGLVNTSGQQTFTALPTGTGVGQGSLYVNPASAGAGQTLLGVAVGGAPKMLLDSSGNLTLAGTLALPNTTSGGTAGVITLGGQRFAHAFGSPIGTALNTFVGLGAGNFNMTGTFNTAIGANTLSANADGGNNTATGANALLSNTSGTFNTATGVGALLANTTGGSNTASGFVALRNNTTGSNNTAIGASALFANTTISSIAGHDNTATGAGALFANTTGTFNTATGSGALSANTTSGNNSAFGYNALSTNTTGHDNAAFGAAALQNNTTDTSGNAGSNNAAFGAAALFSNTTGAQNAAFGYAALFTNAAGNFNSAFGTFALFKSTGDRNAAFGTGALQLNTLGNRNAAFGALALNSNTTGVANAAFGDSALQFNTTDINGKAGSGNSAFGASALINNTTGSENSAFGSLTLNSSSNGSRNSAFGTGAFSSLASGDDNIAIGRGAGGNLISGSNDVYIGNLGLANESNTIRIGNSTHTGGVLMPGASIFSGGATVDGQLTVKGSAFVFGNFVVNGMKSSMAKLSDGRTVALYAVESPENWFEDFGTARLEKGVAKVSLDPTFLQTVNTETAYHVFLTPNGYCRGLYVAKKTHSGFEVRELGRGKSNVAFDYRIVAKRRGYEAVRLKEVSVGEPAQRAEK